MNLNPYQDPQQVGKGGISFEIIRKVIGPSFFFRAKIFLGVKKQPLC
jgi:hypothetical protein